MSRQLPKIVFLDRDGTINEEVNYLHRPEDFRLCPVCRRRFVGFMRPGICLW